METVPLNTAEQELSALIHRAAGGETIIIKSPSGERVRLEPVSAKIQDRVPGLLKGKITVPAGLFEPASNADLELWYGDGG